MSSATNRDIIALLECPVCCDLITPPAYQCQNGHTLCSRCYQELSTRNQGCPICRVPLPRTGIRSLTIDNLGDVEINCRNGGCTAKVKVRDMNSHLAGCVFSSNGDGESINGRINSLFNDRARGRNHQRGRGQAQGSRRGAAADRSTRQRPAANAQVPTHQAQPPTTNGLSNTNARPTQQTASPLPSSQIHGTSIHHSNPTVIIIQGEGLLESTENSSLLNPPLSSAAPASGRFRNCTTRCCCTAPILILSAVVILVAGTIGGFVVGAQNWFDCPASSQVPVTLFLGCLTLTIEATLYAVGFRSKNFVVPALFIYIIILAFSVFDVLSIATTVQFNDSSLDNFCAPNVYIYTFIYNIFVIIAAIGLPFGCCTTFNLEGLFWSSTAPDYFYDTGRTRQTARLWDWVQTWMYY